MLHKLKLGRIWRDFLSLYFDMLVPGEHGFQSGQPTSMVASDFAPANPSCLDY